MKAYITYITVSSLLIITINNSLIVVTYNYKEVVERIVATKRRPSIKPLLGQRYVFTGSCPALTIVPDISDVDPTPTAAS